MQKSLPCPAPRRAGGSPPQSHLALHSDANNKQTQTDGNTKPKKNADDGAAHRARTPGNTEGVAYRGFGQGALGSVPTCAARQLEPNAEVLPKMNTSLSGINPSSGKLKLRPRTRVFPKMKIGLDLDARVELAQITWGSCSSLDKASICPSKIQRKLESIKNQEREALETKDSGTKQLRLKNRTPEGNVRKGHYFPTQITS